MSLNKYHKMNEERILGNIEKETVKTKRVAAYCRVSTDSGDQAGSLKNQQEFFRKEINSNPDWVLYDIFTDEGKSGTSTKKREAFNRMMECARNGEIDLIVTKEISRFARNVLDCLTFTQELFELGVEVKFLTQNISTFDSGYKIIFLVLSAFAQEESRTTSARVKFGQKQQMEKGVVFGGSMLGYDVKDGKMTVNKEGAEIVKRIFYKAANEGKGSHVIARELMEEGFFPKNSKNWSNIAILRVLRNEKYCGDLVQGKTYTPNYLTHEREKNNGEAEFHIIENHHEPIVSREVFERANEILDNRSESQTGKSKYSNRYTFSGKIKCGTCGSSYSPKPRKRADGTEYREWRCQEAAAHGSPHIDKMGNAVGCHCSSIRNEDAVHLMNLTLKSLNVNRARVKNSVIKSIKSVISGTSKAPSLKKLEKELQSQKDREAKLLDLYIDGAITKQEYADRRNKLDSVINNITDKIEGVKGGDKIRKSQEELFADIEKAIDEILDGAEYEDLFYREILDKMVIIDKDTVDVYLNFLPEKWRYVICNAAKNKYDEDISETEEPISVNSPIPILSGMVNL